MNCGRQIHFNFRSAVCHLAVSACAPIVTPYTVRPKIPRQDMGFVEIGQAVKVKMNAYNFAKYGFVEGTIALN